MVKSSVRFHAAILLKHPTTGLPTAVHAVHSGSAVEVCMRMGIPIGMAFSGEWDSHGNPMGMAIAFGLLMGMEVGMGITSWE